MQENVYSNWGEVQHEVPQDSTVGSLRFSFKLINYYSITSISIPILSADDTSIITAERDEICHVESSNLVFTDTNKWFIFCNFILNFDETNFTKLLTNKKLATNM